MDAVELPLPANVVVSKLNATGKSSAADSSVFKRSEASSAGSFNKEKWHILKQKRSLDAKRTEMRICRANVKMRFNSQAIMPGLSHADAVYAGNTTLGTEDELYTRGSLLTSLRCEGNGGDHYAREVFPRNEEKQFVAKSEKNLGSISCSKRPRIDQPQISMKSCGSNGSDEVSQKVESGGRRCNSSEKSRILKQKQSLDAKRTEKRICRANAKMRFDSLAMKPGLSLADSVYTGDTTLGTYGLKSNIYNVTRLVDDPPLSELLDGSYRCPKSCPDKVKKVHQTNENVLVSIKKALDVLPTHSAKDGSCKAKSLSRMSSLTPGSERIDNGDRKDECAEERGSSSKAQDSLQSDKTASILYQPRDLFNRLGVPPGHSLQTLISKSNLPVLPVNPTLSLRHGASLPPFPWSFNIGTCKFNSDMNRSAPVRSVCQSRWIRIGSNSSYVGEVKSGSFEIDMQASCNRGLVNHEKNDLLHSVISLISSEEFCVSKSGGPNEVHLQGKTASGSDKWSSQFNGQGKERGLADSHINLDPQDSLFHGSYAAECCSKGQSNLEIEFEKKDHSSQKSRPFGNTFAGTSNSGSLLSTYECGGCNSTISGISKEDHSTRALAAARLLYEWGTSNKAQTRKRNNVNLMWKKESSNNALKAHKIIPHHKTEDTCEVPRHHDLSNGSGLSSARNKLIFEKNSSQVSYISREPVRWSDHEEGPCPSKSEKVHGFDLKPLHVSKSTPTRAEKSLTHQQRLRKIWTSPPSTFNGPHSKD